MLQKRLKRFFQLIKKDLFSNEAAWIIIIKIIGGLIILIAIGLTIVFALAGIGYLVTLVWREPYIHYRSESNVFDSYTNVGLAFCFLAGIAGYLMYGILKIFKWLLQKWKESEKED